MRYRILGPMEVSDGTPHSLTDLTPRAPKLRTVLATLLVRAGEVVPFDALVDELWGDAPPRTATTTLQVYVSQLRKRLKALDSGHPPSGGPLIHTRSPGYVLICDASDIDRTAFEALDTRARRAYERGDAAEASVLQRRALAQWRGDFLTGTPQGTLLSATAVRLAEQRIAALELRIDADLRLGRHHDLIPELHTAVAAHPLREELYAQLMVALYRSGRQAEALQVFTGVRTLLVDELGVEPGVRLQRLQQRILAADSELHHPSASSASSARAGSGSGSPIALSRPPTRLPAPDPHFINRDPELAQVLRLLRQSHPPAAVAITGPAGIGKSALAAEAARQLFAAPQRRTADYPDGLVRLDLQPSGDPLSPDEAVAELRALGGGSGLRALLLLDGAVNSEQLRPLLAASPRSTALVTMRRTPTGLDGVASLALPPMTESQARLLLRGTPDENTTHGLDPADELDGSPPDDPAALDELAVLCGGLPLALRALAALRATRSHWSARRLATWIDQDIRRLATLPVGEVDVLTRLRGGYEDATPALRRAFRLLALLPTRSFPLWAAASVLDVPGEEAEALLEGLTAEQLLRTAGTAPDGRPRYRFEPLLRVLAADLLRSRESTAATGRAAARMCAAYADHPDAAVLPALAEVVATGHAAGQWPQVVRLTVASIDLLEAAAAWESWAATHDAALDAADRLGDTAARARILHSLGDLAWQRGELERAEGRYRQARQLADQCGEPWLATRALVGLADIALERDALQDATALLTAAHTGLDELDAGRTQFEALRAQATAALLGERTDEAVRLYTRCAELADALRDQRLAAYARRAGRRAGASPGSPPPSRGVELRPGVWRLVGVG